MESSKMRRVAAAVAVVCLLLALQPATVAAHFNLGISDEYYSDRGVKPPQHERGEHLKEIMDRFHQHVIDRANSRRSLRVTDEEERT
ncbi:hypothetical protein GUJ93_ZPchr0002g24283 [Zizania palustris]|uniref:Uncharacterized protein n=1 Tax=Zizania palustris TaxID=103762 RepID=A0A8J5VCD2_ZIZPA|nr:hypothetical protein GUJ93_ZPchr0002g24283 [Zizania palustris]